MPVRLAMSRLAHYTCLRGTAGMCSAPPQAGRCQQCTRCMCCTLGSPLCLWDTGRSASSRERRRVLPCSWSRSHYQQRRRTFRCRSVGSCSPPLGPDRSLLGIGHTLHFPPRQHTCLRGTPSGQWTCTQRSTLDQHRDRQRRRPLLDTCRWGSQHSHPPPLRNCNVLGHSSYSFVRDCGRRNQRDIHRSRLIPGWRPCPQDTHHRHSHHCHSRPGLLGRLHTRASWMLRRRCQPRSRSMMPAPSWAAQLRGCNADTPCCHAMH